MERVRPLSRTLPRLAFAVSAAWLLLYELRAVAAPELDAGPLTSRFAHDVVLIVSSLLTADPTYQKALKAAQARKPV